MNTETTNKNRIRRITIRLTEQEYQKLLQGLKQSVDRKLSDHARKLLSGKPVKMLVRNQSMDVFTEEMAVLRKELNALGNNFNQVVKRINSVLDLPQLQFWLKTAEGLQQQLLLNVTGIQSKINQFSAQWYAGS